MCDTVSDSKGPVSGTVVMVMQDRVSSSATTDSKGHYSMTALRPGTYRLLVTVEVHAGDKITQDLKMAAAGK